MHIWLLMTLVHTDTDLKKRTSQGPGVITIYGILLLLTKQYFLEKYPLLIVTSYVSK